MGVPKFYRWISERYPCLSEVVKEYQIPEFDNLYLDMNGIIHTCSHPEDDNPHFRITEKKIFQDIAHYIEVLFRMIRPQKTFFLAVDGVAPRAKMNQQRGRRFRSAKEAEKLIKAAEEKGEILPTDERFDSNCITPGTEFMVRLNEYLRHFIALKISSDPLWRDVNVILSGHETPGEGEHKIMDYIRWLKSKPEYNPNTRHCLYGLDADLIMLGLTTHEPHFSLLREEVKFGKKDNKKKAPTAEETVFHLFHLSLMREYLDFEFSSLKNDLKLFQYDLERIIDDWVFMGFLVGNDFIPHLPHLHIHHDALPLLWETYKKVLPSLGGYMNNGGELNLQRFELYIKNLSQFDFDKFENHFTDLRLFNEKTSKGNKKKLNKVGKKCGDRIPTASQFADLIGLNDENIAEKPLDESDEASIGSSEDVEDSDDDSDDTTMKKEFRIHKNDYYMNKLEYPNVDTTVLLEQAEEYVKGLQWILKYYYDGVPSWSWYYPFHYSPFMSDICGFSNIKIEFEQSQPFLPFEQLMGVLPAASKKLLPGPFQRLMTEPTSSIIDYYPVEFELDLNGKQQDWEAVVKIPFIEEKRLLEAMKPLYSKLTQREKQRNHHGPHISFRYSIELHEPYVTVDQDLPNIIQNHCQILYLEKDLFRLKNSIIKKGLLENTQQDIYFPGFPTLKHLPHTAFLKKGSVKVFQMQSRSENMFLKLLNTKEINPDEESKNHINKEIFVKWPHLFEVKVTSFLTKDYIYLMNQDSEVIKQKVTKEESDMFKEHSIKIIDSYKKRWAIDIGKIEVLIEATPMSGRLYTFGTNGAITLKKLFYSYKEYFAYQTAVFNINVADTVVTQYKTLTDVFPSEQPVFILNDENYGQYASVVKALVATSSVKITYQKEDEPILKNVYLSYDMDIKNYVPSRIASETVGISSFLFSRLTGNLIVNKGSPRSGSISNQSSVNIALNLKSNKKELEVSGYTWKDSINNEWLYSTNTINDMLDYKNTFPIVFQNLERTIQNCGDFLFEEQILNGSNDTLAEIRKYINDLPCTSADRIPCGCETLQETQIKLLERTIENYNKSKRLFNHQEVDLDPRELYRPMNFRGSQQPDSSATYQILDRIINVREGYTVPLGLKGTIVGITTAAKPQDIIYEIIFDEIFNDGIKIRGSKERGYRLPANALINLTYGSRKKSNKKQNFSAKDKEKINHKKSDIINQKSVQKPKIVIAKRPEVAPIDAEFQKLWSSMKNNDENLSPVNRDHLSKQADSKEPSLSDAAKKLPKNPNTSNNSISQSTRVTLQKCNTENDMFERNIPEFIQLKQFLSQIRVNQPTFKRMESDRNTIHFIVEIPELNLVMTGPPTKNELTSMQAAAAMLLHHLHQRFSIRQSHMAHAPVFVRQNVPLHRMQHNPRFHQGIVVRPQIPISPRFFDAQQIKQKVHTPTKQQSSKPEKVKPKSSNKFLPLQVQLKSRQDKNDNTFQEKLEQHVSTNTLCREYNTNNDEDKNKKLNSHNYEVKNVKESGQNITESDSLAANEMLRILDSMKNKSEDNLNSLSDKSIIKEDVKLKKQNSKNSHKKNSSERKASSKIKSEKNRTDKKTDVNKTNVDIQKGSTSEHPENKIKPQSSKKKRRMAAVFKF